MNKDATAALPLYEARAVAAHAIQTVVAGTFEGELDLLRRTIYEANMATGPASKTGNYTTGLLLRRRMDQ